MPWAHAHAHALALAGRDAMPRPVPVKSEAEQADLMHFKVRRLRVAPVYASQQQPRRAARGIRSHREHGSQGSRNPDREDRDRGCDAARFGYCGTCHSGRPKGNERIQRLMTVPGVGPIIASVCAAKLGDASRFDCGRDFAAWLGLTPKQHSSGGKRKLGCIAKAGGEDLRSLLVLGAAAVLIRTKRKPATAGPWALAILRRRPFKVAAVALAARNARILWALLKHGSVYEPRRINPLTPDHA